MGFGESLIAVPLFLFFLPANIAVPLAVMISITIAIMVLVQDHSKIHIQSAKWLIIYSALGIPLGIMILLYANEAFVKAGLGLLIVLYSLYSLIRKMDFKLEEDHKVWLFVCGFISGIFGGAYGLNGPPLVVYGTLRRWNPPYFRATLQAYFFPVGILTLIGYAYKGLVTWEVGRYYLLSLVAVIPAVLIGRYLNHRLKEDSFLRYAYIGLVFIGLSLILNTWVKG